MKNTRISSIFRQCDHGPFFRRSRVALRGQHDTQCTARIPVDLSRIELAVDGRLNRFGEVAANTHHDRLRLRVTHAAVEFKRANVIGPISTALDHQAGIEETRVTDAVASHAFHRRANDFTHHLIMNFWRHYRRGGIRTHAARVGTLIVIEQTLMILARGERENMFTVDHYDEGSLFTFKEILNDHASTGSTKLMPFKHGING